jgi:hypothetical protein
MLIVSGVYLALGLIYLRFWWAERVRTVYLAFTISCISYTLFSWFELGMSKAATPEAFFLTHGGPFFQVLQVLSHLHGLLTFIYMDANGFS